MKIRLTLFACLFVLSASAQYTIWTVFDTLDYQFSNRYSFNDDKRDYPEQSVYWNHGILTIGTLQDTLPFNKGGFYINYTDTLGNVVWLKKYMFQNASQISARRLLVVNSSRFYVIGNTFTDVSKTFVSKFNAQGDSIFYKEYQNDNPVIHMDLIVKHTVQDSTTLDNTANADSLILISNEAINYNSEQRLTKLWVLDTLGNRRLAYTSSIDSKRNFRIIAHKNHYYVGGTDYYDGWGHGEIDVFGADLQLKTTLELDYADYGPKYFSQFLPWNDTLHAIFYFGDVFAPNANSDWRYFDTHVTNSSLTVGNIFGPYCSGGYNSNVVVLDDTTCALVNYCGRPFELKRYNRKFQEYESDVILFGAPFNHFPSQMGNIFVTPTKRIGGNGVYTNGPNSLKTQETWLFLTESVYQLNSPTKPNTNGPKWAINVFPNPFNDYINVEAKGLLWDMDYTLYEMLSSTAVKQGSVNKTQAKAVILTDDLKPGIYFLKLHYNQDYRWYKLIK